jgi:hypothetical protein
MSVNDVSRIIIDDSKVMLQIVAPFTDNSRGVIYNCRIFIVQASSQQPMSKKPFRLMGKGIKYLGLKFFTHRLLTW